MKAAFALALLLLVGGCVQPRPEQPVAPAEAGMSTMKLKVDNFNSGDSIPSMYTCDGSDERPDFSWSEAPEGAKSFAVSVIDYDVPKRARADGIWVHWLVKDIPATVGEVKGIGPLPKGAEEVANDFGKPGWGGPCPPDKRHNYYFRVYALKVEKLEGVTKENFHDQAKAQSLAIAEVIANYERKG